MESWIALSLLSAIFLGIYDIAKKKAVTGNAVPPVLLLNVSTAAVIWGIPVLTGFFFPTKSLLLSHSYLEFRLKNTVCYLSKR